MDSSQPSSRWKKLASRLREIPAEDLPDDAPLGFATRIVARAQLAPTPSPLTLLRNWSLVLAGASLCVFLISSILHQTPQQFLPLPEPEFPTPITQ